MSLLRTDSRRVFHDCSFRTWAATSSRRASKQSSIFLFSTLSFIIFTHHVTTNSDFGILSAMMHPADPVSANEPHIAPNINQPDAPLQGYIPNIAPSAVNAVPALATNGGEANNSVQVNPELSIPQNTSISSLQFLDPSTLSKYPVTTQEIIKRYSENAAGAKGTPEWEAAREQVMRSVGSSEKPQPISSLPTKQRGRPRGRPRKNPILPVETRADVAVASDPSAQPQNGVLPAPSNMSPSNIPLPQPSSSTVHTPTRGRGRGRPRGRGSARGGRRGKRKRSEDNEDASEVCHSHIALVNEYKLISILSLPLHRLIPTTLKHTSSNRPL